MQLKFVCLFACTATMGAVIATAQTSPTVVTANSAGNNGAGPNGIFATTNGLFFTQPFCVGNQTRGIYKEDLAAGTSTLVAAIPDTPGTCAENALAISTGLGGFTLGDTFVTGVSTTNSSNDEVFENGSTLFVNSITNSKNHVGVTFDTAGTFGGDLIATTEGAVTGYDPTGAAQFTYPLTNPNLVLEGGAVAPLTYAACPGCLFVTATPASNVNAPPSGNGAIYFVSPGTPSGTAMTLFSSTPGPEPEGLVFIGNNNLSCTLAGADGAAFSYFVAGYDTGIQHDEFDNFATNGAILAYTPAQIAPFVGQILVPDEGLPGQGGIISAFSGPGAFTTFSNTDYQLEESTVLPCPSSGCPATFGFWKHHSFPSSMFVGGTTSIGCKNYDAATLVNILDTSPSGGNAVIILAHQLIAAIANFDAGAKQTPDATAAIGSAIALLCANNINMSTAFVQASTPLGQQMTALADTLDAFNSSGSSCEGTGLTIGLTTAPATPKTNAIASLVRRPTLTKVNMQSEY